MQVLIDPAVGGVKNVLGGVGRTPSITRVVMTSSLASCLGDNWEHGADKSVSHESWDHGAKEEHLSYYYSKGAWKDW